jgi:uncharacterized protein (TIGR02588 family)
MNEQNKPGEQSGRGGKSVTTSPQLAEWVSLVVSVLLIVGLAGYLLYEALQSNEPLVPVEVQPSFNQVTEANGRFILPVNIANRGQQTLRSLKIEVDYRSLDSTTATIETLLDYLGERSEQTAYFYFEEDPRKLDVKVRPASYQVE